MEVEARPISTCWSSAEVLCGRQGVDAQLNYQHSCSYRPTPQIDGTTFQLTIAVWTLWRGHHLLRFMMVIIVIACVLSAIMFIWEPSCESWSLPWRFETLGLRPRVSKHPGRDQLSQVGSQMNIINSKHTLLYNYLFRVKNKWMGFLYILCTYNWVVRTQGGQWD